MKTTNTKQLKCWSLKNKKDGEKEGNEKLFYFSVNMLLLIKEKYEISSYTTKEDDIKLSSWYQASYIHHRKKEAH